MKEIANGLYINPKNINSARIFEKEGKFSICFTMNQGEPVFCPVPDKKHGENIIFNVLE